MRTVDKEGALLYDELLRRSGDPDRTSVAVRRLVEAGYVVREVRLRPTAVGREALQRLDDPETRGRLLGELLYRPPDTS